MEQYTGFSVLASLATVGLWIKDRDVWQMIEQEVKIKQKTIKHQPHEKLRDALINILAGGHGIVEVNKRVRTDKALQIAFGRSVCAEPSVISETLNACTEANTDQLEEVLRKYTNTIAKKHFTFGCRSHGHGGRSSSGGRQQRLFLKHEECAWQAIGQSNCQSV